MKFFQNRHVGFLAIVVSSFLIPFSSVSVFSQSETLEGVQYTPPQGWVKTLKQGAATFTDVNKNTNAFCILTVYASTPSTGTPNSDFANEWNSLVVKPFKAQANPKTESQTTPDGWQGMVGGSEIESDGVRSIAILSVFSGFGKTVSVLAIFNDQSYLAQMQAFVDGIKLDKTPARSDSPAPTSGADPFPDRPGYQPQKPLVGTLKETITMQDLVGTWGNGAASVQTYVDSSSGNYASTDTTFYSDRHTIKADGSFEYGFTGRANNHTVRETDSGTVTLSGSNIIFKFKSRSTYRYQLIAYMIEPNGAAIITLIHLGENEQGYDAARMRILCDHTKGYIQCAGGEDWSRQPNAK
ncbi:MAG: hypothetical protein ABI999_06050 [Acidobacteriota bacterium]